MVSGGVYVSDHGVFQLDSDRVFTAEMCIRDRSSDDRKYLRRMGGCGSCKVLKMKVMDFGPIWQQVR